MDSPVDVHIERASSEGATALPEVLGSLPDNQVTHPFANCLLLASRGPYAIENSNSALELEWKLLAQMAEQLVELLLAADVESAHHMIEVRRETVMA